MSGKVATQTKARATDRGSSGRSGHVNRSLIAVAGAAAFLLAQTACAAENAKVTVALDKPVNVLTATSLALPALMHDADAFKPASAPFTRLAGVTVIRYPAGSVADLFHWSTNSLSKYKGSDPPYINPDSSFGNFARNLDKYGTAEIVVNYGSNAEGTGGGDPGEAAAWVAYANGDASDTRSVPRDEKGSDWKTIGFWATLRGQDPLATDDGFNFLRISHPKPFGILLWQIGNQIYNNGFFGVDHTGAPDLHGPIPEKAKDLGRLAGNGDLSPAFFGSRVVAYAAAMKAVDSSIRIGVALSAPLGKPGDWEWEKKMWVNEWNDKVLRTACQAIDFVTVAFETGAMQPDWKTLNEAGTFDGTRAKMGEILEYMLDRYKHQCPANHVPRVSFSPVSFSGWAHLDHPVFASLWAADTFALMLETGADAVSWPEMHGDSMLSGDGKKQGNIFLGMELLHVLVRNPGDQFVTATSSSKQVSVHASRRRDGLIGLMLINQDPNKDSTLTVQISGANIAAKGRRIEYGRQQAKTGTGLLVSEMTGLGSTFTVTVPAYSITDILISPQN